MVFGWLPGFFCFFFFLVKCISLHVKRRGENLEKEVKNWNLFSLFFRVFNLLMLLFLWVGKRSLCGTWRPRWCKGGRHVLHQPRLFCWDDRQKGVFVLLTQLLWFLFPFFFFLFSFLGFYLIINFLISEVEEEKLLRRICNPNLDSFVRKYRVTLLYALSRNFTFWWDNFILFLQGPISIWVHFNYLAWSLMCLVWAPLMTGQGRWEGP